jgi:hypothetical protein
VWRTFPTRYLQSVALLHRFQRERGPPPPSTVSIACGGRGVSLPLNMHATLQPSSFCYSNTSGVPARRSTSMIRKDMLRPPRLAVCSESLRLVPRRSLARPSGRGGRVVGFRSCCRTVWFRSPRALHMCVLFSLIYGFSHAAASIRQGAVVTLACRSLRRYVFALPSPRTTIGFELTAECFPSSAEISSSDTSREGLHGFRDGLITSSRNDLGVRILAFPSRPKPRILLSPLTR